MKKNLLSVAFLVWTLSANAFSIQFKATYIPIDSLTNEHAPRYACLDLKTNQIELPIDGQQVIFEQTAPLDSANQIFGEQYLVNESENGKIMLQINELLSVSDDSVYVSASYQKFNLKGKSISKSIKIKELAISKSDLSGVAISPPKVAVHKSKRTYGWFVGGFGVVITALAIIFGG